MRPPRLLLLGLLASATSLLAQPATEPTHWRNAPTPPMGWNSWDYFGTTLNEAQAREQADAMAAALKPAGYDVFTVDIQWYEPNAQGHDYKEGAPLELDAYSRLQPAVKKFPSAAQGAGFKPLADYVHSKGLRFGIHIMRGIARQAVRNNTAIFGTTARAADIADTRSTCSWNPDMYGVDLAKPGAQEYYDSLFALYAAWGVDFVKVDDIARPYDDVQRREIEAIRRAIDKTGRPIVLSLSPGDTPIERGEHVMRHANLWRISDDFWDRWEPLHGMFGRLDKWTRHRAAGAWPDADMLPFGLVEFGRPTRFTQDEQTTCMTLWCIARSPLIFGGDLTRLDTFTRQLLTNPEVLAVNQHSENNRQLSNRDDLIVWTADVPGSRDRYVALFNAQDNSFPYDFAKAAYRSPVIRGTETVEIAVPLTDTRKLALVVADGGDNMFWDHADWLEPVLTGPAGTLDLAAQTWNYARSGNGEVRPGLAISGKPLLIDGQPAPGFGAHAPSIIEFNVPGGYDTFRARARLSPTRPEGKGGSVEFLVLTDTASDARPATATVRVALSELGIKGGASVRDLCKRADLGTVRDEVSVELPLHGAALYRVSPRP
ncbi:MAG TPA: NPCBM/NEW2 domain-containing protein [Opitutaceae bacterium]|nr:NPCBM/NEW2 domain-containing protein [Opitutaceae bacterium]HOR25568.1 NPCBM/NEW2 domain-containing protein [Opitutaceae bacterium]HPK49886.1 NPCBM/NEW2 domain-containing protein [Opitutaceae bacterium]